MVSRWLQGLRVAWKRAEKPIFGDCFAGLLLSLCALPILLSACCTSPREPPPQPHRGVAHHHAQYNSQSLYVLVGLLVLPAGRAVLTISTPTAASAGAWRLDGSVAGVVAGPAAIGEQAR